MCVACAIKQDIGEDGQGPQRKKIFKVVNSWERGIARPCLCFGIELEKNGVLVLFVCLICVFLK